MSKYTAEELRDAKKSLFSTLCKCQKMQESGRLQSSQKTLNDRRVDALKIAIALIDKELGNVCPTE